ncbi:MAG: dihydropteroate synthase [Flavobacteriaceae bacterium CG_4_8_14_3_um_filter_34_10]|nr:MAG: dihydropteroate synthase [Flavobacteriaceae bacterium CG2_30_34_30]PIQ17556.1 MAG: dihydropteroate synthase [Flavobacteriaceae bacterium CG18_big_fil_WC_8_21_14_2_50_34_36]PIV49716.1 MAG: dihydropteroate synthase [Flavobacteriaceae bacterium CG02_land_8_20_14_3_00_34_13]PIX08898.1 MAG: dihydropteroate synthase [Flavobacteriaceae bacterium CG_4_8_14_3_um_filter_34_10]PIZ07194.1 MAG: dihydropteroate synthase [Flavobacteriaceae bacterium CG_4_10_14_0_8_um_filter_34_31]PJC06178.1 MAG: dihy
MQTITCKGFLINFSMPKVMGILNLTPDSFYDGGKLQSEGAILKQAEKMLHDGATFLDVGGYSSRPNAEEVSLTKELQRVVPVIENLIKQFPEAVLSIDTFRSEVAKHGVEAGAALVNDISAGLLDENMLATVAHLQVPYVMMHMRGTPQTMQALTTYKNVTQEVLYYFSGRIAAARKAGINDILADPGFGFAKTTDQNFELLSKLELFKNLDIPVLVGLSRKSMVYKTLGITPQEALNGTTALHTMALLKGASILRVHDVKEAIEVVKLVQRNAAF